MISLLLGLALASPLQQVHELEWSRGPAVTVAAQAAAESQRVRIDTALALGRLQREEALDRLDQLRDDPDPEVRAAVADALGWTPGSEVLLRAWLDTLEAPQGLADRAAAERGVRVRAIGALGRQGDASDLARLQAHLAEPWPTSVAAAKALGRLGRRKVDGAEAAIPALVDALSRPDPRTVEAAAYGIRRIGLTQSDPELVQAVLAAVDRVDSPQARAWLIGALGYGLEGDQRIDLFVEAATDPSPVVRVAALEALGPEDELADLVSAWLWSDDPWVRHSAVGALGRMGAAGELQTFVEKTPSSWEAAYAIEAAGRALGIDWRDPGFPIEVRASALGASDEDPQTLIAMARSHEPPPLRSAAAAALVYRDEPDPAWADRLLGSPDVGVREAALELLQKGEDPDAKAAALVLHLRAEKELELLGTGLTMLADLIDADPQVVDPADAHLRSALRRAWSAPTARVRQPAERIVEALEIEAFDRRENGATRELVLPDGSVVQVSQGMPVVSEVHRIRGARVRTSRGEFVLGLDPHTAPLAVHNFATLAEAGFYDGVVFHRVVPGFVIQTGCPRGDGWGGPGWSIPDEVSSVPYDTGSLGMARSGPDTGGSQWFVSTAPTPHLEGDYTRFGEVVQGMAVARAIQRGDTILSIEIERLEGP